MPARKPQRGSTRHIQKILDAKNAKDEAHSAYVQAIREAREAGLTGEEIGEALGLTRQRVYQLSA